MLIQTPPVISRAYYKLFAYDFTRFVFVGGVGFVVNYIMLAIFFAELKLPILLAQLISAEIALIVTFSGNNFWAFKGHHHISIKKKLLKYHATAGMGILITTAFVAGLVKYAHLYYGLALLIGACAGLIWNYTFNRKVIFKNQPPVVD